MFFTNQLKITLSNYYWFLPCSPFLYKILVLAWGKPSAWKKRTSQQVRKARLGHPDRLPIPQKYWNFCSCFPAPVLLFSCLNGASGKINSFAMLLFRWANIKNCWLCTLVKFASTAEYRPVPAWPSPALLFQFAACFSPFAPSACECYFYLKPQFLL